MRNAVDRRRQPCANRSLPWWRLGPCLLAIAALAWLPSFGTPTSTATSTGQSPPIEATLVAHWQQPAAPPISLPEIDLSDLEAEESGDGEPLSASGIEKNLKGSMTKEQISAADLAAANQMVEQLTPVDWLGPLAPVALSPFFGITCLSGLALWSPEWMPGNGLLDAATPLKNPNLFWAFAALTIITSLPRLSKVSKPVAVAVDKVEAYAGIITLIAIRYIASPNEVLDESPEIVEAGIVSGTVGALLYVAMVINVLVINSVKFFFEFLIWLTPIPFLDACFEFANKTMCAGLMALYALSPTLATVLNLAVFVVCLLVLRWINRRVHFYRHMVFDSLWPMFQKTYGRPSRAELVVFPKTDWNGFQDKACVTLCRHDQGWTMRQRRWFRTPLTSDLPADAKLKITRGWLTNTLEIRTTEPVVMIFSRRYHGDLHTVAELIGAEVEVVEETPQPKPAKTEFA
ncbi:hypothetical protein Poly24_10130 [Rosistilla carotiformis]|uniref:Uncharacterized protein n=1 Tax=Rosistilla carotiformis TaxID=2528017 RepID=A0A518JP38_9BACT|nr:hypothetical protein [Rosistilla carotiformis]QDV67320.1 hypothetical protein Poly24_10130 [Rosistilla carotiformis]